MGLFDIIGWIILGAVAGWIASIVMKTNRSQGLLMDIIVGIVGAFIGGWLFGLIGIGGGGLVFSLIRAVIGAVILLAILRAVRR